MYQETLALGARNFPGGSVFLVTTGDQASATGTHTALSTAQNPIAMSSAALEQKRSCNIPCGVSCGVVSSPIVTSSQGSDADHPANFGRLCIKGSTLVTAALLMTRNAPVIPMA
jgi:anaerobic selenocysteine-containing dehydrogenase